jgi:flagellar hook-associated protein 2
MSSAINPSSTASTSASSTPSANTLITSTGIGSGLDIASIVSSLTTAHGAAQSAQLNAQSATLDSEVSAYGTFTSALDTFKSSLAALEVPSQLAGFAATVADKSIATATTTSDAVAGQYSLLVNNLANAASLTSEAFSNPAAGIGTGTLTITVAGKSSAITIDSTNNTLSGIASAINSATDNPGVTASIITTTAGARLVITGTSTGVANAITVSQSGGDGGLAPLAYDPANATNTHITQLTQTQAAQDASFSLNGFAATSANNVVSGAITGVTINLLQASAANTPTTLNVTPDTSTASTAVGTFVSSLNGLVQAIQGLTAYDPSTQTAGALNGDATLESFQNQLLSVLGQVNRSGISSITSLADIGITANADGSYASDTTKLGNALSGNLAGVANLLGGTNGLATQLDNLVNGYTKTGGILDNINQGLESQLKTVSQQQDQLNAQLAIYSATLTAEYNAMDTAVAQLKETQQYLTAEFNPNQSSSTGSSTSSLGSGNLST